MTSMELVEFHNVYGGRISYAFLKKTARAFYQTAKINKKKRVSLALIGDKEMRVLNKRYRKINRTTDVLSFSESQNVRNVSQEEQTLGEILISYPQAKKQAKMHGHSVTREIQILFIHGLAHLIGHDHETRKEADRMEKFEKEIQIKIGLHK